MLQHGDVPHLWASKIRPHMPSLCYFGARCHWDLNLVVFDHHVSRGIGCDFEVRMDPEPDNFNSHALQLGQDLLRREEVGEVPAEVGVADGADA